MGPGLRTHLLGQPRFFYNGQSYAFHSRPRALGLFSFFLLHRGAHQELAGGFEIGARNIPFPPGSSYTLLLVHGSGSPALNTSEALARDVLNRLPTP